MNFRSKMVLLRYTKSNSLISCCRNFATKKKKIPTEDNDFDLPVFEYPKSKSGDRRVYVWGLAETGALGIRLPRTSKSKDKTNNLAFARYPMRSRFAEKFDVTNIVTGYGFTAMSVKSNDKNKVFGMGINTDSQIGYHAPRIGHPLELLHSPAPIYLPFKNLGTHVTGLAAGRAHLLVLTDEEGVFTLGNNSYGQCGRKIIANESYKGSLHTHNIRTLGRENIASVSCGQDHSLFITASGKVYACGWSADGQTGTGSYENQYYPSLVKGDITSEKIIKVASTGDCVLALSENGELFGWGNSEYGQVPMTKQVEQVNVSYALLSFTKGIGRITDIATGGSFCAIVNHEGDVFVWGFGLLGLGPNVQHSAKPTLIPPQLFGRNEFNPESTIVKVDCGISHLGAISNTGDLYMWGRNRHGCLGLGHLNDQPFPLKVSVGAQVLNVDCGVDHTVAFCKPFI